MQTLQISAYDNKAYEKPAGDPCEKRDAPPPEEEAYVPVAKFFIGSHESGMSKPEQCWSDGGDGPASSQDPWASPEFSTPTIPWRDLDAGGVLKRILWDCILRQVVILGFLYIFICSLDFLSSAFRLVGGKAVGEVFSNSDILSNPVTGVMIGVLATVILQSSSTTTSIVVAMVGSDTISVALAIPIIMGANIGTSVTNTLVSLGQAKKRDDFRRAFGGATVHDMFNWLTVIVMLPVEIGTGYLLHASNATIRSFDLRKDKDADIKLLSVITDPLTKRVMQLDKDNLIKIATCKNCTNIVLAKMCPYKNITSNGIIKREKACEYLFESVAGVWSDEVIGAVLLTMSIVVLCTCLIGLVKILQTTLRGAVARVLKRIVNTNIPFKAGEYFTGYIYVVIGTIFTILLQSSSIFTSAITPLVGFGVLPIERAYALTLGSNVGTTATAILAALAGDNLEKTMQIALCHLYFNLTGIVLWYIVPALRFPIPLAKKLGNITARYRWFSIAYVIGMFLILPGLVFALSIPGWYVLAAVAGPVVLVLVVAGMVNLVQHKNPKLLPQWLQTWDFLPLWMRSLQPIDRAFQRCCCKCCQTGDVEQNLDAETAAVDGNLEMGDYCGASRLTTPPPPPYQET